MQVMNAAEVGDLNLFRRGKVRDTFQLADGTLLMIATDRLSVFDVVLPTADSGKGHGAHADVAVVVRADRGRSCLITCFPTLRRRSPKSVRSDWLPRSMHVGRAQRIDVECVVRGFISGSGWKEYRDKGTLAGEPLHEGLRDSSRLPSPTIHARDQEG